MQPPSPLLQSQTKSHQIIKSFAKYYVIKTLFFTLALQMVPLAVSSIKRRRRNQMEKLKPERVVEMLKAKGVSVTVEQAASIIEFLRKMASSVVSQYLKTGNNKR